MEQTPRETHLTRMRPPAIRIYSLLVLGCLGLPVPGLGQTSGGTGRFKDLLPEQQQPVFQIVERYNQISGKSEDAEQLYNSAKLSVRTTYDAITNALLSTRLTSADGRELGNALGLIDAIEEIAGEIKGEPGDRQFRIYAVLKPGAVALLDQSVQFRRGPDNTVYHRGYPLNYRMRGIPSIQISIARDGKRADVDVDYRSSGFPAGLFNGHLTSANSDVRVGDNYSRHSRRWQGLFRWWLSLFGASAIAIERAQDLQKEMALDTRPAMRGKLEDAVQDFYSSWLLEKNTTAAVSYFSRESFGCLEQDARQRGEELPPGLFLVKTKLDMDRYVAAMPAGLPLPAFLERVEPWDSRLRPASQSAGAGFSLFEVPESLVKSELACQLPERGTDREPKLRYGKFFASVNRFKTPDGGTSGAVLFIWAKERKRWAIVGVRSADGADPAVVSLERRSPDSEERPGEEASPDSGIIPAVSDFLESWFVKRDYSNAMSHISPRAKGCVETADQDRGEDGFARVAKRVGRVRQLREALNPVAAWNAETKVVRHPHEDAFTLLSLPAGMGQSLLCENREKTLDPPPVPASHGQYYATIFVIQSRSSASGALLALWEKEGGAWKLVAWEVQAP
jgi:hypothetical protein